MKVYNKDKTTIIEQPNLQLGYIKLDTLRTHIPAISKVDEVFHYEVIAEYANGGKSVKKVIDKPQIEPQAEYWKEEDIYVYIPYTEAELQEIRLNKLRTQRKPLLEAFDKWEKAVLRGRELDDEQIMNWFYELLDLKQTAFDNIPENIKYYIVE